MTSSRSSSVVIVDDVGCCGSKTSKDAKLLMEIRKRKDEEQKNRELEKRNKEMEEELKKRREEQEKLKADLFELESKNKYRNETLMDAVQRLSQEENKEEYFRFLLLGKTGSGKSSTGNTIFGEKLFASDVTFGSVTQICELKSCKKGGRLIDIMDSPGLYDTSKTQEEICTIIVQAVACMHPGPHAILYVVKMGRYTDEEYGVYNRLKKLFDASITKYIIILFTGGDELEAAGKTLADMLKDAPEKLIEVVEDCNHRCMIFNNKAKDKQPQVNRLLDQVRKMNAENNNSPYACPKYASVGEGLEAEVARRLAEVNKRDAEREQYVKELEERKAKAEEELKRTKRNFQRKEREREKELREEREKREREKEELREKLKKKETEAEIQEKKKKSAAKDEDREEEEKKAEALARQQEELRQSILRREREQEELLKRLEEERKREKEEIRRREQEREELERKRREEERKEKERQRRAYEEEMRRMKEQIAENKEQGWVEWATKGVSKWLGW